MAKESPPVTTQSPLDPIPVAQKLLGGIARTSVDKLVNERRLTKVKIGMRAFIVRDSIYDYLVEIGAFDTREAAKCALLEANYGVPYARP